MTVEMLSRPATATTSMKIVGVGGALPTHRYPQPLLTAALKHLWGDRLRKPELLEQVHANAKVDYRHLAYPMERYAQFSSWGETNKAWLEAAEELGAHALDKALAHAGMSRDQV